jgi:alginate O-acetyltransferase complex protein AlgI
LRVVTFAAIVAKSYRLETARSWCLPGRDATSLSRKMVFNSLVFIGFFAIVAVIHHSPASWRVRKIALLVASYVFYGAWNPPFLLLLWASTVLDFYCALAMEAAKTKRRRKAFMALSLVGNLGMLGYFKYGPFVLDNFHHLTRALGIEWAPPAWNLILPVGISFYTFHTLSYTLDVYRGELAARRSLLDFGLAVSFFPQLVAGPIMRAAAFLPQLEQERRGTSAMWANGLTLTIIGLFQKMVLADGVLAPMADSAFLPDGTHSFADAWIGTLAFSGQIFFDFAGYSLCALGIARCLGFELVDNFRGPYGALGFSDFWRRWHISLSTWLRDYLYVSLGGNRRTPRRTYINLMITMLIGGLWHGASWAFVVWGGLHGVYLAIERWFRGPKPRELVSPIAIALGIALTYGLVCITWVFFRASDFTTAWQMVCAMVGFGTADPGVIASHVRAVLAMIVVVAMVTTHIALRKRHMEDVLVAMSPWVRASMIAGCIFAIAVAAGGQRAFIYFQF